MKCFWKAVVCGKAILCSAAIVAAQGTGTPVKNEAGATTVEASHSDLARLNAIITQLSDPNFTRREAAQKELENSKPEDLKFLRSAAENAKDAEIKSRLEQAMVVIQDNAILNPPPINLSIDGKGLQVVASALGDVLHVKMQVGVRSRVGREPMNFTINARNTPFWEVFFALSNQHPLVMNQEIRVVQIDADPDGWRFPVMAGPMAVIPQAITRTRKLQVRAGENSQPEILTLACIVALDPRIPLSKVGPVRFTEITDELGNNLATELPADILRDARRIESYPPQSVFPQTVPLKVLDKMGKRIVSAKGSVHFVVDVGEERVEVQNADKRTGETFAIGGFKFKLTKFEVMKREAAGTIPLTDYLNVSLENIREPGQPVRIDTTKVIFLTLTDANGREMAKNPGRITGGISLSAQPDGVAPFKLTLSMTNRTKDLVIPFELKDLRLP